MAASQHGDQVTVTWSIINMTEDDDRGYLLDVWVCQNGELPWWPVGLSDEYQTSYTFTDQAGCAWTSGGKSDSYPSGTMSPLEEHQRLRMTAMLSSHHEWANGAKI